jgi:hypothetical protein
VVSLLTAIRYWVGMIIIIMERDRAKKYKLDDISNFLHDLVKKNKLARMERRPTMCCNYLVALLPNVDFMCVYNL